MFTVTVSWKYYSGFPVHVIIFFFGNLFAWRVRALIGSPVNHPWPPRIATRFEIPRMRVFLTVQVELPKIPEIVERVQ